MAKIDTGKPCKKCGCTWRYKSGSRSYHCVDCMAESYKKRKELQKQKKKPPDNAKWTGHGWVEIGRTCERCGLLLEHELVPDCGDYCGLCLVEVLFDYRPEAAMKPDDWWDTRTEAY